MSIATAAVALLSEAGVTSDDILMEVGKSPAGAVAALAERLGVDLTEFSPAPPAGTLVEVTDEDVAKVREGLAVLNRIFG